MPYRLNRKFSALLLLLLAIPPSLMAFPHLKKSKAASNSDYLDQYLKRARSQNPPVPDTSGSLWVSTGPLSTLATDYRAQYVGDLILIHLVDSFSAATNAENNQSRKFATQSSVTSLLGKLSANNSLQNLLNGSSSNSLDGKGQSTMSSNVSMNIAAQVLEVLPNGVLVVQATRDITMGNDRQTVVLRGLVRPGDLALDNSISSNSVANLEVEIKGKGAVAEASRQPNIVVRTLLRLFTF